MILGKALILKGLGGVTALGATATAAWYGITSLGGVSPESLIENAGFKCTFNGDSCEITAPENGKKINVKNNTTKVEGKTFTISNPSTAKIKVQKNVTEGGYNQNLKLTIEGGDINLTGGTASGSGSTTITKLEQFETYEIVKEGDKYYLSWKRTAIDEKSKALGLPSDCKLPSDNNTPTTCSNITKEQLKEIKFDGKGNNEPSIANDGTPTITLTITKTTDTTTYPKGGYKFAFQSDKDITISSTSPAKYIKKNTNTEFKIKETTPSGGSTEKTLSLEKAWTVTEWGKKVGLTCPASGDNKECSLPSSNTLNLYIGGTKTDGATISEDNRSKKIKYEEDAAEHNQGFKFYAEEDINLNDSKKIDKKNDSAGANSPSYEIKEIDGQWYLAKKETTAG